MMVRTCQAYFIYVAKLRFGHGAGVIVELFPNPLRVPVVAETSKPHLCAHRSVLSSVVRCIVRESGMLHPFRHLQCINRSRGHAYGLLVAWWSLESAVLLSEVRYIIRPRHRCVDADGDVPKAEERFNDQENSGEDVSRESYAKKDNL